LPLKMVSIIASIIASICYNLPWLCGLCWQRSFFGDIGRPYESTSFRKQNEGFISWVLPWGYGIFFLAEVTWANGDPSERSGKSEVSTCFGPCFGPTSAYLCLRFHEWLRMTARTSCLFEQFLPRAKVRWLWMWLAELPKKVPTKGFHCEQVQ
jgi:hypothetical protein